MKKMLLTCLLFTTLGLPHLVRAEYVLKDAALNYVAFSPEFNFYDAAWAVEGEIRRYKWQEETMGWSLILGLHNWDINDRPEQITAVADISSIRGSASYLVGGLSYLYRAQVNHRLKVTFELGTRVNYGLTSANGNVDTGNGSTTRGGGIDVGTQITGIGSINSEVALTDDWRVTLGGGYQVDIVQGDIKYAGQKVADNELNAAFFRFGLLFEY